MTRHSRKNLYGLINSFSSRRNGHLAREKIKPLPRGKRVLLRKLEGLWKLTDLPRSRKKCPECKKSFSRVYINGIEVDICVFCRSMWLDKGELKDLANLRSEEPAKDYIRKSSKYNCPICHRKMYEHMLFSRSNLLVDICSGGDGIYLESNEINRVLDFSR